MKLFARVSGAEPLTLKRSRRAALVLLAVTGALAAAIAGPALGEGNKPARIAPDPPPLMERTQWVFDLRWERGEVYLVRVHKTDMGAPRATPRVMGRFALELYEGPTLIERVRFDFPLLGPPDAPDAGFKTPPRVEPLLKTRIGVIFPATSRGTRLELWDRALDRRWPLPWPPEERVYADPPRDVASGIKDAGRG